MGRRVGCFFPNTQAARSIYATRYAWEAVMINAAQPGKVFDYTVVTKKNFEDAVEAVESKAAEKGFRVLHTHDVAATLAEKGIRREALKIVEICNAKYANEVLDANVKMALMLPCPITIYRQDGKTYISTLLPGILAEFSTDARIAAAAEEIENVVVAIVDESK